MESKDTDAAWEVFVDKVTKSIEENVPVYKNKPDRTMNLWMNQDTISSTKRKRKAWYNYIKNRKQSTYEEYRKARNEVTKNQRNLNTNKKVVT